MFQLEAAGASTTLPAPTPKPLASARRVDLFAQTFETMRRAIADRTEQIAARKQAEAAPDAEQPQTHEVSQEEDDRSTELKDVRADQKPGRLDRMRAERDNSRPEPEAASKDTSGTEAVAASDEARTQPTEDSRYASTPLEGMSDTPNGTTSPVGEDVAVSGAPVQGATLEPMVGLSTVASPQQASSRPSGAVFGSVPTAASPVSAQPAIATGTQSAVSNILPAAGSGSERGSTGAGSQTLQARTVSSTDGGAGAKGASGAGEFHGLLEAAGRTRAQVMKGAGLVAGTKSVASAIPLAEPGGVAELANVVRSSSGAGRSTMVLTLDPPDLGKLRIDVRMHDQALTVRFEAQTQAGHDALTSRLGDLRQALEQHGVQVNQFEVELRPPTPPHQGQDPQQSSHQGWNGGDGNATGGQGRADSQTGSFSSPDGSGDTQTWAGSAEAEAAGEAATRLAESGVDLVA